MIRLWLRLIWVGGIEGVTIGRLAVRRVLETPAAAGAWVRGATIAVRSLRSGLPRPHPRCRLRRLPSDSVGRIYTPRAPRPPLRRARVLSALPAAGRVEFFRFLPTVGGREKDLAGPARGGRAGGLRGLTRRLASGR